MTIPASISVPTPGGREPGTDVGPVRRFTDRGYLPLAATLGELRQRIDSIDDRVVALLAERAACVRDATRFKRDAYGVAAPARQAEVFARVRSLAVAHGAGFPQLPDIVEAAYRALVAGFVADEATLFSRTEPIEP